MKAKFLTIGLCAAALSLTSCDFGGDIILYSDSHIDLYAGQTSMIDAESTSELSFRSQDDFHATVSRSGRITAEKVGRTKVYVMDDWGSRSIVVDVNPRSNLYEEPLCDEYLTRSEIIREYGEPSAETNNGLKYESSGREVDAFLFLFNSYGEFISSVVLLDPYTEDDLDEFIEERYAFDKKYSDDGINVYGYLDAYSRYEADLFVGVSFLDDYIQVSYIPNSIVPYYAQSKGSDEAQIAQLSEIDAAVKELL